MKHREIKLYGKEAHGAVAIVDEADFALVCRSRWYYYGGYAVSPPWRMHRHVMGCTDPELVVDHINGDRLNNRRENLRIVTRQENKRNRRIPYEMTEHDGIRWNRFTRRWVVVMYKEIAKCYLGEYRLLDEAMRVRDAEESYGGFTANGQGMCERGPYWAARSTTMILSD